MWPRQLCPSLQEEPLQRWKLSLHILPPQLQPAKKKKLLIMGQLFTLELKHDASFS